MKTVTRNLRASERYPHFIVFLWIALSAFLMTPAMVFSQSPSSIDLRSAGNFSILAATTVTSTGGGTINNDLGVWPGSAFVPGTPPLKVNGIIHLNDPIAAQAQADLLAAYNDGAGRTSVNIVTLSGNLGGMTLKPGLYKSTSSLEIASGDLTLDGQGDENAVWIFQIASTLTTTSGRSVILSGSARAANIFWIVGSSATFGTTSVLKGNVLAWVSITSNTDATMDGMLLAHIGAVTFNGKSVTRVAEGTDENGLTPKAFSIAQNYPNPFNPVTTIRFELPSTVLVSIRVSDLSGRELETLVNGVQSAGAHEVVWNAANHASGIYFYRIEAGSFKKLQRMLLIK